MVPSFSKRTGQQLRPIDSYRITWTFLPSQQLFNVIFTIAVTTNTHNNLKHLNNNFEDNNNNILFMWVSDLMGNGVLIFHAEQSIR